MLLCEALPVLRALTTCSYANGDCPVQVDKTDLEEALNAANNAANRAAQ